MPSKSRRAASRQAKLRQRRRRGKAAPQAFDVGPTERRIDDEETDRDAKTAQRPAVSTRAILSTSTRPPRMSRRAKDLDASAGVAPSYRYLGVEIRRIGVVAGFMFIILAILTFVMGD